MATSKALTSSLFTFLVGEEQKKFQVHSRVLSDISAPLGKMMTNGMQESIEKKASLVECSVESFELFLEYAYTGNYHVIENTTATRILVKPAAVAHLRPRTKRAKPARAYCGTCGTKPQWVHFEEEGGKCKAENEKKYCHRCGHLLVRMAADGLIPSVWTFDQVVEESQKVCYCGTDKSSTNGIGDQSEGSTAALESVQTSDTPTTKLCVHAALYLFADKYLVEPLKNLCLHKLHRDLIRLDLDQHVDEVVSLLSLLEDNTSEDLDANSGGDKTLRGLCLAYAIAMRQELAKHDSFKQMIAAGGDLMVQFTSALISA